LFSLGGLDGSAQTGGNQKDSASGYELETASALLDQRGWLSDEAQDGEARLAAGVAGIADGTPLQLLYLVEDRPLAAAAAQAIKQSLAGCGIGVNVRVVPPESLWDRTNEDSAFSGNYDLLQLSWQSPLENVCALLASGTVEDGINQANPLNFSRFNNSDVDSLCERWAYARKRTEKQAILAEIEPILAAEIPFFPLFFHPKNIITRSDFCAASNAFSQSPELVDLEAFRFHPSCQ
jgi:ABC-type transport system substrate-binding protein